MGRNGKRYNQKFKDGVIRMIQENGRSVASVATDLGIAEQTIYQWLDKAKSSKNPDKVRIVESLRQNLRLPSAVNMSWSKRWTF